jgi:hypothetical protein
MGRELVPITARDGDPGQICRARMMHSTPKQHGIPSRGALCMRSVLNTPSLAMHAVVGA